MAKKKYKIQHLEMASISEDQIPDDVLERLEGYDILNDDMLMGNDPVGRRIFAVSKIGKIAANSKDNDTNETTRLRVEELWYAVNRYDFLMITK